MTSFYLEIHPVNPQTRLIRKAADIVRDGGVIVIPTDSSYALVCRLVIKGSRLTGYGRIRQIDERLY